MTVSQLYGIPENAAVADSFLLKWLIILTPICTHTAVSSKNARVCIWVSRFICDVTLPASRARLVTSSGVRCHVPALQVWHLQVRTPHNWSELSLPLLCLYLTLVSAALLSTPEEGYVIKCKHKKSEILQHILAKKKEKERPQLVNVLCPFLLALIQEKK